MADIAEWDEPYIPLIIDSEFRIKPHPDLPPHRWEHFLEKLSEVHKHVVIHVPRTLKLQHRAVSLPVFGVMALFTEGTEIPKPVGSAAAAWDAVIDV